MRENHKNQGSTCDLPCSVIFHPKPEMLPTQTLRVDTHISVIGFCKRLGKTTISKTPKGVYLKNSSPDSKADFSKMNIYIYIYIFILDVIIQISCRYDILLGTIILNFQVK